MKNKKKITLLLKVLAFVIITLSSCDKRKDIISEKEELENVAPNLGLRRYQSGLGYTTNFIDTFLVPVSGYKLQYTVSDINADLSSLNLVAVSSASNVLSITHYKDSLYFLVKLYSNIGTMNFQASVKDKFGLEVTSNFKLISVNQRPQLKIKKTTTSTYTTTLVDTLKSLTSTIYSFDYSFLDDNVSSSSISIIKRSVGDISTITNNTVSNRVSIDLTSSSLPKTLKYDIVVTDPFSLVSDTNKITLYYYRNLPPKVVSFTSCGYLTGLCQLFNSSVLPTDTVGILLGPSGAANQNTASFCKVDLNLGNLYDSDIYQGGYLTKIRYKVTMNLYTGVPGYVLFSRTRTIASSFSSGNYVLRLMGPFQQGNTINQNPTTLISSSFNIRGYLFDNNNDSTFFNLNPVF